MTGLEDISSLEETAQYLRMEPAKLRRLALAKEIGHIRAGRQYLFPRSAVEAFVKAKTVEASPDSGNRYGLTDGAYRRLLRQKRD